MMEIFDVVDEYGNPTGETVTREKAHLEGIRHHTAHLWILCKKDGKTQVLLQKRCMTKASYPGLYDISSAGHIPAGCDYVESALRELNEELGISAEPDDLVPVWARTIHVDMVFGGKPFHDRQYSKVFAMWLDREESEFTCQPEEVECVRWMDLDECLTAVEQNTIPNCIFLPELQKVKEVMCK